MICKCSAKAERENESVFAAEMLSLFVSDIFAITKVMLFSSLVMMLLPILTVM